MTIAAWIILQATHVDVSVADFIALGAAASAFPGGVGLLLFRKWDETDKSLKKLIAKMAKVETVLGLEDADE